MSDMLNILDEALILYEEHAMDREEDPVFGGGVEDLQQSGYLTNDEGLVVTLADGRKYIIKIQEV